MHLDEALALTSAYATPETFESFSRHLDRVWIEEALLATGKSTIRRRRLPSEQVVWLVLGMGLLRDLPIADVVERLELALEERGDRSVARSAIPPARVRLGAEPLEWLFVRSGQEWAHRSAERDRWRGLSLWGLDGTTMRVPDSEENRTHFVGQPGGASGRGDSGYPSLRLVVLMTLRSHLIAAANFGPYSTDERTFAEDLWSSVPDQSLVIVDRGYVQASVMALGDEFRGRHWLIRSKKNTLYDKLEKLGKGDFLVDKPVTGYSQSKEGLPPTLRMRAIEYRFGKETRVLLTSLLDPKRYPADEIVALYRERWEIELGYGELKTDMLERQETIRSKSPEAVAQELWGILIAYNLVRLEMEQIAEELDVPPLRISFLEALRSIREQWLWAAATRTPGAIPKRLSTMRARMRRFVLPPRRIDRSYPRAVKIKMSNYARNRRGGRLK
jgi:hypothetical protein